MMTKDNIDNLLSVIKKLVVKHRNMRQRMTRIVNVTCAPDELSVCDNCEAEMPSTWLDAIDGICVFCGKMHTEE